MVHWWVKGSRDAWHDLIQCRLKTNRGETLTSDDKLDIALALNRLCSQPHDDQLIADVLDLAIGSATSWDNDWDVVSRSLRVERSRYRPSGWTFLDTQRGSR